MPTRYRTDPTFFSDMLFRMPRFRRRLILPFSRHIQVYRCQYNVYVFKLFSYKLHMHIRT